MFLHKKELLQPVKVDKPDPKFGQFLLEQFGGATGELTAALQYWVQSFHVDNPGIRDMLQDIAVEEFGHLEMLGQLIELHTRAVKPGPGLIARYLRCAERGRIFWIAGAWHGPQATSTKAATL